MPLQPRQWRVSSTELGLSTEPFSSVHFQFLEIQKLQAATQIEKNGSLQRLKEFYMQGSVTNALVLLATNKIYSSQFAAPYSQRKGMTLPPAVSSG